MELFASRHSPITDNEGNSCVKFFSMHPGWSETDGLSRSLPTFDKQFKGKLRDWQMGADTIVWLACVKEDQNNDANHEIHNKENVGCNGLVAHKEAVEKEKQHSVVLQSGEFYFDRKPEKKCTLLDFGATSYSLEDVKKMEEKLSKMANIA